MNKTSLRDPALAGIVSDYFYYLGTDLLPLLLTSLVVLFLLTSMINSPNSYLHGKKYRVCYETIGFIGLVWVDIFLPVTTLLSVNGIVEKDNLTTVRKGDKKFKSSKSSNSKRLPKSIKAR